MLYRENFLLNHNLRTASKKSSGAREKRKRKNYSYQTIRTLPPFIVISKVFCLFLRVLLCIASPVGVRLLLQLLFGVKEERKNEQYSSNVCVIKLETCKQKYMLISFNKQLMYL
ncbi:uncharacterized protein LOC113335729 [Papaver somniferum]|uniref:uncharacterized protein LOC113335729 n=1 Tax=Papaver somniferum TaxID=3469 RepID=UPI000E6FC5F4|nr:uncharacterized protein LOC113335729 [Papaver somniferum]